MFKLVVLSALLAAAVAAPKPGFLHGAPVAYAAAIAVPSAVSHQSRVDVHSSPVIATSAYVAAPAVHTYVAPVVPAAVSHSSRFDLHRSAAVIATPVHAHGIAWAAPLAHGYAAAVPALHAW